MKTLITLFFALYMLNIVTPAYAMSISESAYPKAVISQGFDCGVTLYDASESGSVPYCHFVPATGTVNPAKVNHAHDVEVTITIVTPPTIEAPITEDNTPVIVIIPPTDTPSNDTAKVKHPNNGGGNGQELDANGNDLDPNVNPHANDND